MAGRLLLIVALVAHTSVALHKQRQQRNQQPSDDWIEQQLVDIHRLRLRIDATGRRNNGPESSCKLTDVANRWINDQDSELRTLMASVSYANWDYATNLTDENSAKLEVAQDRLDLFFIDRLPTARSFIQRADRICNETTTRMLKLFANFNLPPVANKADTRRRINRLVNSMEQIYSTAVVTDNNGKQYRLDPELTDIMATSRDYDKLVWAWEGWRNVSGRLIKSQYTELVEKMNEAAIDNGFKDVGEAWQVADFEEADIEQVMSDLYNQIKPLYQQIHAYVRRKLIGVYPDRNINETGPIPAHLLGDMWAQEWSNIAELVLPYPNVPDIDITAALHSAKFDVLKIFETAEDFFVSLGLDPMTPEFWDKSIIVRPADNRPMTCHASAEEFYSQTDFRIKMCTQINAVDLQTVHHEMGHVEYFMEYRRQPTIFRNGANAAFHEAIGDTIGLSVVTPQHLKAIGLTDHMGPVATPSYEQEINYLLKTALTKIAFLPFGYIVDKFRYHVFRGDITPDEYNHQWWNMRKRYQGLQPPIPRTEIDFDPGSKYHVPANVPYSRYFLSFIGQFQFQAALCEAKGHTGPLHHCDIYQSLEAGQKLKSVLRLGSSRPWQEAMYAMTGQRQFKADAILQYFQPLTEWLEAENKGKYVGW